MRARALLVASLAGFVLAVALALVAAFASGRAAFFDWGRAHGAAATYAFLLPAYLAFLAFGSARFLGREPDERRLTLAAWCWLAGGAALALALLVDPHVDMDAVVFGASLVLLAGGVLALLACLPIVPRSGLVRAEEPLTKGDDACAKQLRFSFFMLPLALLLLAVARVPGLGGDWPFRFHLAGMHVLLAGHVLLSVYALGHLWVPRFSGVPAIAAGAIKGELHSTLGGVTLLLAGFLTYGVWGGSTGLLVAGGGFLFLGVFTFMGVLGANIMRNKSRTQRVTPEFVYIPWTFAGVFWLLSGILLGLFLNAVPDALADKVEGLRFTHVHMALFGGAAQLLASWLLRALPMEAGRRPPTFGSNRLAFLGFNTGLCLLMGGALGAGVQGTAFQVGAVVTVVAAAATLKTLRLVGRP